MSTSIFKRYCTEITTLDGTVWGCDSIVAVSMEHARHILDTTGRGYCTLTGDILVAEIPMDSDEIIDKTVQEDALIFPPTILN